MSLIPDSLHGVAIVVALVIPGIMYAAIRTSLQGFVALDRSISSRIIQAVMVSVLLDSIYLAALGWIPGLFVNVSQLPFQRPWELGLAVLGFGILIPALLAYVIYGRPGWQVELSTRLNGQNTKHSEPNSAQKKPDQLVGWARVVWLFAPSTGYRKEPTAWDWIAQQKVGVWIRVLSKEGRWIGGWVTEDTFFSSYPESKDLYIPKQWDLDKNGKLLRESPGTDGVWLPLEGAQLVEWVLDEPIEIESEKGTDDE